MRLIMASVAGTSIQQLTKANLDRYNESGKRPDTIANSNIHRAVSTNAATCGRERQIEEAVKTLIIIRRDGTFKAIIPPNSSGGVRVIAPSGNYAVPAEVLDILFGGSSITRESPRNSYRDKLSEMCREMCRRVKSILDEEGDDARCIDSIMNEVKKIDDWTVARAVIDLLIERGKLSLAADAVVVAAPKSVFSYVLPVINKLMDKGALDQVIKIFQVVEIPETIEQVIENAIDSGNYEYANAILKYAPADKQEAFRLEILFLSEFKEVEEELKEGETEQASRIIESFSKRVGGLGSEDTSKIVMRMSKSIVEISPLFAFQIIGSSLSLDSFKLNLQHELTDRLYSKYIEENSPEMAIEVIEALAKIKSNEIYQENIDFIDSKIRSFGSRFWYAHGNMIPAQMALSHVSKENKVKLLANIPGRLMDFIDGDLLVSIIDSLKSEFSDSRDLMMQLIVNNAAMHKYIDQSLLQDRDFMLDACLINPYVLKHTGSDFAKDERFLAEIHDTLSLKKRLYKNDAVKFLNDLTKDN